MRAAPELATDRLVLRGHTLDDFDDSAALWADPQVVQYIGGQPSSREVTWSRLHRYVGHWVLLAFGFWVARDRASGRFVGELGLADFRRDIEPPLAFPEAGWVLAPWAHGRGLATEGMRAVLGWADAELPAAGTVCIIDPPNVASVRVAEKLGYRRIDERTYKGGRCAVFERPRALR
jgi:RimJ/RimL family protein N-acetyltransferase